MITTDDNVAVLICGEYRTFDVAIENSWEQFKKLPNFNLYFSTWDYSYQGNDLLNIHHREHINENSIKKYFDKNVYVNVMNLEREMPRHNISHSKNLNYSADAISIHLRKLMEIIINDENQWDYIIITRPDLLISDINLNYNYLSDMIYTPHDAINDEIIHDTFFMGKNDIMIDFINQIERTNSYEHGKLKEMQRNRLFRFKKIPRFSTQIIRPNCRNIDDKLNFNIAQQLFNIYDEEKEVIYDIKYDK